MKSEPKYAYKRYAYKKKRVLIVPRGKFFFRILAWTRDASMDPLAHAHIPKILRRFRTLEGALQIPTKHNFFYLTQRNVNVAPRD